MITFERQNMTHIKAIFYEKTGVVPAAGRSRGKKISTALLVAAVIGGITVTAAASQGLFSALDGNDLSLNGTYVGDGIVEVRIENRSDRDLNFQPCIKLSRWTTGEEFISADDPVAFDRTQVPANSAQTIRLDLSGACDVKMLEEPLPVGDWYSITLTNNYFCFGQEWRCSVDFSQDDIAAEEQPQTRPVEAIIPQSLHESLRPYFEADLRDIARRREMETEYVDRYTKLLSDFEGEIVSSVSPVLPGNKISSEMPYLTVRTEEGLTGLNWFSRDAGFKLIAREGEYALVLSVLMPSVKYPDAYHDVPVLYLLTYETASVSPDSYAFVYGQIVGFDALEKYKVFQDERYTCFEVSALLYADFDTQIENCAASDSDIRLDAQSRKQAKETYEYYHEKLSELLYYK